MAIQSLFGPTPAQVMEMRRKEQEQEIMQQGKEFGVFAPLYQAGLRFGEQGRQSLQGLFPGQQDSALKEATAVQSVLAKYADSDQTDPEVLSRIGRELMPIAPNAGLKALTIAKELQGRQESLVGKVNPADFTPESLQAFIASGGKDYSVLREKGGGGDAGIGKVSPADFTPDSLREFAKTKDYSVELYDFSKNIYLTDNKEFKLYNSLELMMLDYPMTEAGSLEAFTVESDILWYQKIPTTVESIRLLITTYPDELENDEDTPVDLPPHLHYKLLVNGAAFFMWSSKEDGVDGEKVNTNYHFNESFATGRRASESGFNLLRKWIVSRKPPLITSRLWY
jgi:hypothetical protein